MAPPLPPSFPESLHTLAERNAAATPDGLALATADETFSHARLADHARRLGSSLADQSPVPILAMCGCSCELALAAHACAAAGRGFWPLDPELAARRWPAWQSLAGGQAVWLAAPPDATSAAPAPPVSRAAPTLVIATSGSAGEAKAVMLSAGNLAAAAAASQARFPLAPGDLWLAALPLFHIAGQIVLWRAALAGAGVLLPSSLDTEALARALTNRPVTHLSLVPAVLARLLDAGIPPPPSLRVVLTGGAALAESLYQRSRAAGWPVHPTWGLSETCGQVATHAPEDGPWHSGLAGRPLGELRVETDARGLLRVAGPQVMLGYLNPGLRPGLGLEDGWLTTGDLGSLSDQGVVVYGRADTLLVSGGVKIHPGEIEEALAACPGVSEVAAAGVAHPAWGELLVAVVAGSAAVDVLEGWSRQHLRAAARPRRFVRVAALPRLAGGKVDRAALRLLAAEAAP